MALTKIRKSYAKGRGRTYRKMTVTASFRNFSAYTIKARGSVTLVSLRVLVRLGPSLAQLHGIGSVLAQTPK